jgi:azurin
MTAAVVVAARKVRPRNEDAGSTLEPLPWVLRNTGKLPANVMGHDWVLTKTSDVPSVANAGMSAGVANNYQRPGDKRIIASTKIIGGGESATVRFSLGLLDPTESYTYFCSAPGHASIMKGRLVYKQSSAPSVVRNEAM